MICYDLPKIITPDRRIFLRNIGVLVASTVPLFGEEKEPKEVNKRESSIYVERYGRKYDIPYLDSNGVLIQDGYEMISRVLGDYHSNKAIYIDVKLLNIIYRAQTFLLEYKIKKPVVITSAYRTPETNAETEGAAMLSQHLLGKAFDGKIEGIDNLYYARLMRYYGATGIGLYHTFVHADTGKLRQWAG